MPKYTSPRERQNQIAWVFILVGYAFVTYQTINYKHQGPGKYSEQNWNNLRKTDDFHWYTVPLLVIVMNVYFDEIRDRNWSAVFAGLAFFFMDMWNEIWNGILYQLTDKYAGLWMINRPTAYQVTVGWNIEIIFTFLIVGVMSTKILPKNKETTLFGLNNRQVAAIGLTLLSVSVEIILNYFDALIWNFSFWNHDRPFFICLLGYFPFFQIAYYVYDMDDVKKQRKFVSIFGLLMSCLMGYLIKIKYI